MLHTKLSHTSSHWPELTLMTGFEPSVISAWPVGNLCLFLCFDFPNLQLSTDLISTKLVLSALFFLHGFCLHCFSLFFVVVVGFLSVFCCCGGGFICLFATCLPLPLVF